MRRLGFIGVGWLVGLSLFWSCREDLDFSGAPTDLTFSVDTLRLDTVYTQYNSETYAVKVYNRGGEDVLIPRISLGRGTNSFYRLNVDGSPGFQFENVPLRSNDSLFVFVEIAVGDVPQSGLYEDVLQVGEENGVLLESYIERVQYYLPDSGTNTSILNETLWDNSIGRFVVGELQVPNNLTIEAGTRIYFADQARLALASGADLEVNGMRNSPVVFRAQRNDARYDSLPGQWQGIQVAENATFRANYARIQNANTAVEFSPNSMGELQNTAIFNNQNYGVFANNATITANNLVVNNANLASIALVGGGNYSLNHCSVANFFDLDAGPTWSLFLSNEWEGSIADFDGEFGNSIFYGRARNAVSLEPQAGAAFNYRFESCTVRNENLATLNVLTDANFAGNTLLEDPLFVSTEFSQNNLRLAMNSPARGAGNAGIALAFPIDFDGITRAASPSMGAFE